MSAEDVYIDLTNLAKLRIASQILGDLIPANGIRRFYPLAQVARKIVARLVIHLESRRNVLTGDPGEWPAGICGKPCPVPLPCSLEAGHEHEACS